MIRLGVAASVVWVMVAGLLASRNETWTAALRLYCHLTTHPACVDTVFLVVHWPVIALVLFAPVAVGWLMGWGLVTLARRIARSRNG